VPGANANANANANATLTPRHATLTPRPSARFRPILTNIFVRVAHRSLEEKAFCRRFGRNRGERLSENIGQYWPMPRRRVLAGAPSRSSELVNEIRTFCRKNLEAHGVATATLR
jgi:hypothetical protein